MTVAISSHPSTDSLDSLVLHDSTGSPGNTAGQGSSAASNPDMEQELIAAAEALLTGQVRPHHSLVPVPSRVKAAA